MQDHRTNDEQIEHLKEWWDKNGRAIVSGIVIGLIAIFGWRAWQDQTITRAKEASDLFEQMAIDISKNKEEYDEEIAQQLNNDYKSTPYSSFAKLLQAREAVDKNDIGSAKKHLQWVLENTDSDEFKHLARSRLARLLLVEGDKDAALSLLEKSGHTGKFASIYHELRGDILLQQGDPEAAEKAYKQALETQNNSKGDQSIVQLKLDDLGATQL